MAMNDLVADMLTRIRNGQRAYKASVSCPHSKFLASICDVLKREGYIADYSVSADEKSPNKKTLEVRLKYFEGQPVIKKIDRVSKCGRREYSSIKSLPKFFNGLGIAIVSTSKGVLSDYEARQQNVGGEVVCCVF